MSTKIKRGSLQGHFFYNHKIQNVCMRVKVNHNMVKKKLWNFC